MQSLQICNISQVPVGDLNFYLIGTTSKNTLALYQSVYNTGLTETLSEVQLKEMEVLNTLFKLGFPAREEGTYLYKDMIMKAIQLLDGFDDRKEPISESQLLQQMQTKYSQFYVDVARNDLDMGIKTFHSYINHALSSVDYACVDSNVLSEVYGDFVEEGDYGKHAFVIAKNIRAHSKNTQNSKQGTQVVQYVKTVPSNF